MPFFSIIVPVYNVEAYVREAITSVLDQDFTDFEVVVIDDRTPDHSGDIADEMALADPRIVSIHLPENVGLGRARNAGVAAATGEYILFLDGDDTFTPGALSAIARRLMTNGHPDLLIYNYARVWWDGRRAVSWGDELLAGLSAQPFVPREHRRLFNLLPIACNKAYRREFLQRQGITFGTGFYEDVPWTYTLLLNAESAITLNRVVLRYRQRRTAGSILATTSPKHFDVFGQYDLVFDEIDRRGVSPGLRKHVYDIMINHFVTILTHDDRLAKADRERFFDEAAQQARRLYRPGGSDGVDNAASNLRGRLFRDHGYRRFRAYSWIDRKRQPLRSFAGRFYWPARRAFLRLRSLRRLAYPILRRLPLDPKMVVFSEYWGTGFGCNPRAIFEKLQEIAPDMTPVWIIEPERGKELPAGVRQIRPASARKWPVLARATYFVNNVNFPGIYVKRPGQIHIQTMHGTPLKFCGLDVMTSAVSRSAVAPLRQPPRRNGQVVATDEARNLKEFSDLLRRSDRWDYALSSNAYSSEMWSHAYPCSYTWLEYGYPRNDALVRADDAAIAEARAAIGVRPDQKVALYAPTFREAIGDTSMRIDLEQLIDNVPQEYVFVVRAHHTATASASVRKLIAAGRVIDGSAFASIVTCYLAADILITDYSSVMFDYALLERPIIIYADDWDSYRESRGTYFDLIATPPGAVAFNGSELASIISTGAFEDRVARERLAAFRERFCTFDDGNAAENVIRTVMLSEQVLPSRNRARRVHQAAS